MRSMSVVTRAERNEASRIEHRKEKPTAAATETRSRLSMPKSFPAAERPGSEVGQVLDRWMGSWGLSNRSLLRMRGQKSSGESISMKVSVISTRMPRS